MSSLDRANDKEYLRGEGVSAFDDFMAQVFDDVVNGSSGEMPRDLRQTDPRPDCVLCRRGERHSGHSLSPPSTNEEGDER